MTKLLITYFLQQVLCRFIPFTYIDCIQLCLVAIDKQNVFGIRLQTMTESTWKILKLDWKIPEKLMDFFIQNRGNPVLYRQPENRMPPALF